jgi:hypothetical protein
MCECSALLEDEEEERGRRGERGCVCVREREGEREGALY